MLGINLTYIAIGIGVIVIGRRLDTFSKVPQGWNPWLSASVTMIGALTFSLSAPAGWISDILGWFFGLFPGGNFVIGMITLGLLIFLIFGLFDGALNKRDITAIYALPILTLGVGGVVGQMANTARDAASSGAMTLVTTLVG